MAVLRRGDVLPVPDVCPDLGVHGPNDGLASVDAAAADRRAAVRVAFLVRLPEPCVRSNCTEAEQMQ
jgi:hypothetical protein